MKVRNQLSSSKYFVFAAQHHQISFVDVRLANPNNGIEPYLLQYWHSSWHNQYRVPVEAFLEPEGVSREGRTRSWRNSTRVLDLISGEWLDVRLHDKWQ